MAEDSGPDTKKPTAEDIAHAAALSEASEKVPEELPVDEQKPAPKQSEQDIADFLQKIVAKAGKEAKEKPTEPSTFLKVFGGFITYFEDKYNGKEANQTAEAVLFSILKALDGHDITEQSLVGVLKKLKDNPALMDRPGTKQFIKAIKDNLSDSATLLKHIRAESEKYKVKAKVETKTKATTKEPEGKAVDIKPSDRSAESQRAPDPLLDSTGKMAKNRAEDSFSTAGPTSAATAPSATSEADSTPTPEGPSATGRPGMTPSRGSGK